MENENVLGAAPTGDVPTTSEWSTILLHTKVWTYIGGLTICHQRRYLMGHPNQYGITKTVITSVRTRQNFQARAPGAFHGRVSSAARAWGHKFLSEAMHVYMGENRLSLWSYHIGTVFKSIQLSFDIYRVSNHHLKFLISIKWSVDDTIYTNFNEPSHLAFPMSNIVLRTSRHACRHVVANVTFQYPASPLRILQFLFMCNDNVPLVYCSEGGLR